MARPVQDAHSRPFATPVDGAQSAGHEYGMRLGAFNAAVWSAFALLTATCTRGDTLSMQTVGAVIAYLITGAVGGALVVSAVDALTARCEAVDDPQRRRSRSRAGVLLATGAVMVVLVYRRVQLGPSVVTASVDTAHLLLGLFVIAAACLVAARTACRWAAASTYGWQVLWLAGCFTLWAPFNELYQAPALSTQAILCDTGYLAIALMIYAIGHRLIVRVPSVRCVFAPEPRPRNVVVVLLVGVIGARLVAGPNKARATAVIATPNGARITAAEVSRLRSLGYLGFTEDFEDEGAPGAAALKPEQLHAGYSLYTNRNLSSARLIDSAGTVIHTWRLPSRQWGNAVLLPDGDLLVVTHDAVADPKKDRRDGIPYLVRIGWNGDVVFKRPIRSHHDVKVTPSGDFVTLTQAFRLAPDVSKTLQICDDRITLLTPEGHVRGHVSVYDALTARPDVFTLQPVDPWRIAGQRRIDLFHTNSVTWMHHGHLYDRHPIYARHNVLICMRHQDAVAIIDWDRREVVWSWGQGELSGPHDATILGNGNILIFDNGINRKWSRVVELDPIARRIVWEFKAATPADFFTLSGGGAQRLPNGNTLIVDSNRGAAFEVTMDGETVWRFLNPDTNEHGYRSVIVQMRRYELDYVDRILAGRQPPKVARPGSTAADHRR